MLAALHHACEDILDPCIVICSYALCKLRVTRKAALGFRVLLLSASANPFGSWKVSLSRRKLDILTSDLH